MKLYRKLDFPEMEFTLYFLGMPGDVDDLMFLMIIMQELLGHLIKEQC